MIAFCSGTHIMYATHACREAHTRNNQVPVCPLCDRPVPVPRGQQPDIIVGRHIDSDCTSDVAKKRIYTNRCHVAGCKKREVIYQL